MSETPEKFSLHQKADLAVLLCLTMLITLYLIHVLSVSTHILNTILVLPVAAIVLVLCVVEFLTQLRRGPQPQPQQDSLRSVLPVMGLFAGYVLTLPWLGFDLGTVLFVAAFLLSHGEKRWYWALAYAAVFGFLVALLFSLLLPYPMPMLLLPTEY